MVELMVAAIQMDARVGAGARDAASLLPLPAGRCLVPGIPWTQLLFDDSLAAQGRWHRRRHRPA